MKYEDVQKIADAGTFIPVFSKEHGYVAADFKIGGVPVSCQWSLEPTGYAFHISDFQKGVEAMVAMRDAAAKPVQNSRGFCAVGD